MYPIVSYWAGLNLALFLLKWLYAIRNLVLFWFIATFLIFFRHFLPTYQKMIRQKQLMISFPQRPWTESVTSFKLINPWNCPLQLYEIILEKLSFRGNFLIYDYLWSNFASTITWNTFFDSVIPMGNQYQIKVYM